jgi:dolichol-phosphate mannosyltransferase
MDLSIIIPTYNEAGNVKKIVKQINAILKTEPCHYEILFVDDSQDHTPRILEQLVHEFPVVRTIHRQNKTGLASAVVEGFQHCLGSKIIVMDADLQHPPELLPLLFKRLAEADIVIPSRFVAGGSDGGLNVIRRAISWTARTIGRLAIKKLHNISDCTSGFFGLNRAVITNAHLDPIGWKILIEVLVKGNYHSVHEIPYVFQTRDSGKSKMSLQEQGNFLRHIARLIRSSPEDRRFYAFCAVGACGVIVNLVSLNLLLTVFHLDNLTASIQAGLIAVIHNFLGNDTFTWRERKQTVFWKRLIQLPQFTFLCGLGIMITTLIAQLLALFGCNVYSGQLVGIILASRWTFTANNRWTWSTATQNSAAEENLIVTQELHSKIS